MPFKALLDKSLAHEKGGAGTHVYEVFGKILGCSRPSSIFERKEAPQEEEGGI